MADPVQEQQPTKDPGTVPADESTVQGIARPAEATVVDPTLPPADEAVPESDTHTDTDTQATDVADTGPEPEPPSGDGASESAPAPESGPAPESELAPSAEPAAAAESEAAPGPESEPPAPLPLVDIRRYRIRKEGDARVIVSGNAPNIQLRVERGLTVDEKSCKSYGAQSIFLDGVYSGPPFLDNEARHYSLDHHAGCVRAFTLSTCEQAVVMLLQGLPLASGMWTLYVNDPDLDSMLAAWLLLNHVELLADEKAILEEVMPVIRLEGVIDAHGTDRAILTGFPESFQAEVRCRVDELMEEERSIKSSGGWQDLDFVRYAKDALERIDKSLLPPELLRELGHTQEAGRASLANGRICVLLESKEGIYAVEARLKERYGSALGVIVLQTGPNVYTLRLVDAFLRKDLTAVYKALNKVDPNAKSGGDNPNLWGGSGDIGGSPRATGTGLSGEQILFVIEEVLGEQPPWYQKLWSAIVGLFKPQHSKLPPA
jgi:hypothetical protein